MKNVFLLEDDEYISRVYERAFRLHGYEIMIAADGEEAMQKLFTMEPLPAAIILDIFVPKMGGEELLKNIKKDARFANIPVAMLTNSFSDEDRQKFMKLGADLFMIKIENTPQGVVEKINALINTSSSAEKAP